MDEKVPLFDELSEHYDQFVNWEQRLKNELPFLRRVLESVGARRVIDAACGTGMHAVTLAQEGYEVVCAEPSAAMLDRARGNAAARGETVSLARAGFGQLRANLAGEYDALLCLGNSLPHALSRSALVAALADFKSMLRSGGVVIIQNRNYDRVLKERERFMPLEQATWQGRELMFFRFMDFGDELLTFNMVTFIKEGDQWRYHAGSTQHRPITREEAESALREAGFQRWDLYGNYQGDAFDPAQSGDLIITAFS